MGDVIFVVVVLAFFAIATLLVRACDHIIGPDGDVGATPGAAPVLGDTKGEVTAR
jgi:hypothetical protein